MDRTILVVDDDPVFRALATRMLTASGLKVIGEAESVADALETAARIEPEAVLVDVGLPDGDGFSLARQLKALPWQPRVLLTSADTDVADSDDLRRDGDVLAFVHKADLPNAPLAQLFGDE
jgi:DNA-binding response OmpR family regulator